jgi:8-oxo-dGTP pyrophosphatase MutT (NUDIX family)
MSFDADRFRADVLALVDSHAARLGLPGDSHALLRRQIALGDAIHDRRVFPGHVTTSAFILDPAGTRTLLIRHRSLGRWLQPGGHYEPPDSLATSALREAVEETGLGTLALDPWHARTGLPIDIDTHRIPARPARNEPEHWHHDIRFLVRADPADPLRPELAEVEGAAWLPVSVLAEIAPQALANLEKLGLVQSPPDKTTGAPHI